MRTVYPDEPIVGPQIRDAGCNPPADDSQVTHVDASRGFLPRLARVIWPGREGEQAKAPPPAPRIPPAEELAQQTTLLDHLENQLAAARRILENDPTRPSSTALTAVHTTTKHYVTMLCQNADVAGMGLVDIPLLVNILDRPGEGLIGTTRARVFQLEAQLRTAPEASPEHRRLAAAAEKSLRKFGESYLALRKFEQTTAVGQRHAYRAPRPSCGPNFGQVSDQELRRLAEFAATLPDAK